MEQSNLTLLDISWAVLPQRVNKNWDRSLILRRQSDPNVRSEKSTRMQQSSSLSKSQDVEATRVSARVLQYGGLLLLIDNIQSFHSPISLSSFAHTRIYADNITSEKGLHLSHINTGKLLI